MSHDQLFKELLRMFFAEFLRLFFPEVAAQLDFSRVKFLDKENFADFPDGSEMRSDVAAEVYTKDAPDTPSIVHFLIEIEGRRTRRFPQRMWEYFSVWRLRRGRRVFPIVVYLSPGTGGIVTEEYRETLFGREQMVFRYDAIGLPDLPEQAYRESNDPLAVALSATMKPGQITRLARKLDALRRILRSEIERGQVIMLSSVIQSYLKLSAEENAHVKAVLEKEPELHGVEFAEALLEQLAIEQGIELGIERGIEQGVEQGLLAGEQRILLRIIGKKFGEPSEAVVAQVRAMTSSELEAASDLILSANSLAEMGLVAVESSSGNP